MQDIQLPRNIEQLAQALQHMRGTKYAALYLKGKGYSLPMALDVLVYCKKSKRFQTFSDRYKMLQKHNPRSA